MSHPSWLQGLLHRVSKSSLATPRKRPAFSPVKIEILEDRTTPVALDWTGAVNNNWNTAGNWVQNQVPSAANNVLNFSSATTGITNYTSNNDISSLTGLTINITDASTSKDFTITGLNAGVTAVTHNKTDNQASATTLGLAMTGVGATITDTAGSMSVLNTANVFDTASTVNVPTGATLTVGVTPSSTLGSAKYNLTGGTLNIGPSGPAFKNAFNVGQNNVANDVSATGVPLASLGTDIQTYPFMSDISRAVPSGDTQFQTNTRTWGNNDTYFYSGEIFFPNSNNDGTGTINFAEQNDDSTLLRIDGTQVISNTTWNVTNTGIITLPTGWHTIDLRFGNGGGGAGPSGQNSQNWALGNASTTAPTGKGFGYRVNSGLEGTDPLEGSLDANDYQRLLATQSIGVTAATESGTTVTITTSAVHGFVIGESIKIAGMTPGGYNGTFPITAITATTFSYTATASGLAAATAPFGTASREVDDGVRIRIPDIATAVVTNDVSVSGSSTIVMDLTLASAKFGNLSMASGATLNVVANKTDGQSLIFGTTALAGNATFSPGAAATIDLTGAVTQAAAANITKTGAGTLNLDSAANNYSGLTTISAGTVLAAADGALGTSTGAADGTVVSSGGRLVIGATYAKTEVLSIAGPGSTATNGALSSAVTATFAGPITLTGDARIASSANTLTLTGGITNGANQVTFAGAGTVIVQTVGITGTGKVAKVEAGTVRLNVASPGLTGDIGINEGTLRAGIDGALGTVAGATNVATGATLRFVGPLTYATLEPLNIAGPGAGNVGAINITGGSVTLPSAINITGTTTIGSGDAGSKLTLSGAITIAKVADLNFTGAGDTDVVQGFGNGATPFQTNAALAAQYLHDSPTRTGTDITGVGAAPGNQGLLVAGTVWEGNGLMKGSMNIGDPADPSSGGLPTGFAALFGKPSLPIANFSIYFSGQMNVTTPGVYRFATGINGLPAPDALNAVYVDKNKNHIFEDSNTELLLDGSVAGSSKTGTPLAVGTYDILIPYTNGGGSGSVNIFYSNNDGAGYQLIDPSRGTVAGTNFTNATTFTQTPTTNINKNGTGTVTLLGANTFNGTVTINAGTLVAGNANALSTTTLGTVVKNGGTLGFTGNVTVANEPVTFNGTGAAGQGGAISNISGNNSFTGTLTAESLSQGTVSLGSNAGTLTLNGTVDLKYSKVIVGGAGDLVVNAALGGIGTTSSNNGISETIFNASSGDAQNNIEEMRNRALGTSDGKGILTTQINYADDGRAGSVDFAARAAALGAVGFDAGDLGGVWVTTFTPNESGAWLFHGFAIDDNVGFWLDIDQNGTFESTDRFGARGCCGDTGDYTTPDLVAGKHYLFGISLTDTGGGGFLVNVQFQSPTAAGAGGGVYSNLDPSAFPGLFQVTFVADNSLVKNGAGTLTLNAANTYNGNTTVNGGTVNYMNAAAYGTSPTSTLTVAGATSVVNLFNNATATTTVGQADFSAGSGTVNTGPLGGKLAIKNSLKLAGGYTATGNMTAQGANLVDNATQRTLTAVSGTLDVAGTSQGTITKSAATDNGQMFLNGTSQTNTFSYTANANADVLIVSITGRTDAGGNIPVVTYGGTPLKLGANSMGTATTYVNSHVFYLYNPTKGVATDLEVDFPGAINGSFAVYAYTLKGVDTNAAPKFASVANTEGSPTSQTVTVSNVAPGSWAVSEFTYRLGNNGILKQTTTNGTPNYGGTYDNNGTVVAGGTTAAVTTGDYWYRLDGNIIASGGLFSNLTAGSTSVTATGAGASGTHFSGTVAVFAPKPLPSVVNLPATNFSLPNGTSLTINGPGDAVIGSVGVTGNASIGAGTNAPSSLTIGGGGDTGAGALTINNNLGFKLATGSTFKVDVNGTTAGTQYDQTNVNGAVNLNGATLNVTAGFAPTLGDKFTIITNDSTDAVVGTFAGLPQGATVSAGAAAFTISYNGGDGNDVVLTAAAPGATTTTTLVANPLATTGGSSVQFTATVAPTPDALGTVNFLDNGVAIAGGSNIAVVGGVAVFSTTTLAVGTHPVTAVYSGAAGFAGSTSAPVTVTITSGSAAPSVTSVTLNGGVAAFSTNPNQRSRVVNLTVLFDQAVLLDTGAMALALYANNVNYGGVAGQPPTGGIVPSTLTVTQSTDSKTWTMTFGGTGIETGTDLLASLKDGVYKLTIDRTKVHPVGSPTTNMAADSTTVFHRLYGDVGAPAQAGNDFTAVVNTGDNLQFRGAFNKPAGGGYLAYFDVNGDGIINTADNLQFRTRFNKNLTWTV